MVYLFAFLLIAAITATIIATHHERAKSNIGSEKIRSRPIYHGLNAAIWTGVPSFVFLILWLLGKNSIINSLVLASYPGVGALS